MDFALNIINSDKLDAFAIEKLKAKGVEIAETYKMEEVCWEFLYKIEPIIQSFVRAEFKE